MALVERYQPATPQLTRLTDDVYASFEAVSVQRLRQIEALSPVVLADVDDQDKPDVILDIRNRTESNLEQPIEAFLDGGDLATMEDSIADTTSNGILAALLLGSGGIEALRNSQFLRESVLDTRRLIQGQLRATQRTADQIAQGQLTEGQIRAQARRRSLSIRSGFSSAFILDRMTSLFHNEGIRRLNSAHPCPDCPGYERPDWTPIDQIVPVATFCVCQSRCKCSITTRFSPQRALQDLLGGNLLNRVQRRSDFLAATEQAYLERNGWA